MGIGFTIAVLTRPRRTLPTWYVLTSDVSLAICATLGVAFWLHSMKYFPRERPGLVARRVGDPRRVRPCAGARGGEPRVHVDGAVQHRRPVLLRRHGDHAGVCRGRDRAHAADVQCRGPADLACDVGDDGDCSGLHPRHGGGGPADPAPERARYRGADRPDLQRAALPRRARGAPAGDRPLPSARTRSPHPPQRAVPAGQLGVDDTHCRGRSPVLVVDDAPANCRCPTSG